MKKDKEKKKLLPDFYIGLSYSADYIQF